MMVRGSIVSWTCSETVGTSNEECSFSRSDMLSVCTMNSTQLSTEPKSSTYLLKWIVSVQ